MKDSEQMSVMRPQCTITIPSLTKKNRKFKQKVCRTVGPTHSKNRIKVAVIFRSVLF